MIEQFSPNHKKNPQFYNFIKLSWRTKHWGRVPSDALCTDLSTMNGGLNFPNILYSTNFAPPTTYSVYL